MILIPSAAIIAYGIFAGLICGLVAVRQFVSAIILTIPALFVSLLLGPVFFLMGLGLFVIALVTAARGMKWQAFAGLALLLLVIANAIHSRSAQAAIDNVDQLRAEFPVRSLKARLAFHQQRPVPEDEEATAQDSAKVDHSRGARSWMLKRLHEESYRNFVAAPGFGISRMARPRIHRRYLELPPLARTPVASKDICFENHDSPDRPIPVRSELQTLHQSGLDQFIDAGRLGYVENIDRVIGFEPHGVAKTPAAIQAETQSWQVARLELVSLLRHEEPVAYVSDNLPNLEELEGVPTRPLDDFEQAQLPALRNGDEIATASDSTLIRMLGAVRANETCLACHSVPIGSLLGAFTYEIRPVREDAAERNDPPAEDF